MIQLLHVKYHQFIELWKKEGLLPACKFSIYRHEEAVPVEKDLSTLDVLKQPEGASDFKLIELHEHNFYSSTLEYPLKSRKEKVFMNIQNGYRTYVLIKNNQVVADIWYVTDSVAYASPIRKYLLWFGIKLNPEEVYLFDMHLLPDERGKGIAAFFMGSVLQRLKDKGIKKVYGYFNAKNIPAMWVHRLLKFQELPRVDLSKLLWFEFAKAKPRNKPSLQKDPEFH
jgi:GNAT superfamily N-acetyltransferase